MGYLANFMVYTLAMVGVIILTLLVFKYSTGCKIKKSNHSGSLKVIDSLSLSTRKTLYVVETNGEKFLIAGDIDRTTLISKLNSRPEIPYTDLSTTERNFESKNIGIHSVQKKPYESVMRSLAEKIRE